LLYLILCRIFQLLVLLGRGDRAKEIEILALRHQVFRATPSGKPARPQRWGSGATGRAVAATASHIVERLLRDPGDAAALAP
jgi:hypothetical protein